MVKTAYKFILALKKLLNFTKNYNINVINTIRVFFLYKCI